MRASALAAAVGLTAAACGPTRATDASTYEPVATVRELMDAVVVPASDAVFDAIVYTNGVLEQSPRTDDDWARLRLRAMTLAEAGNLLLLPGRSVDGENWVLRANQMIDGAVAIAAAAESRDTSRVLETGSVLYRSCVACHEQYVPE